MNTYIQKLQKAGFPAVVRQERDDTLVILGGSLVEKTPIGDLGEMNNYKNPFRIEQTATGWKLGCSTRSWNTLTFECASLDEAVEKLAETYRSLGFIKDNQRAA